MSTKDALATTSLPDLVYGDRPVHQHFDPVANQHWNCNSPYCNDMKMAHPQNGGPTPIIQGFEPWRR